MTRPQKLKSQTWKMPVACCNLFITITDLNGKPYECFIKGSARKDKDGRKISGGCKSSQEAMASLVGLGLKRGLIKKTIEYLDNINPCQACISWKKDMSKEDKINLPSSCSDAIARVLKQWKGDIKKDDSKKDEKINDLKKPS